MTDPAPQPQPAENSAERRPARRAMPGRFGIGLNVAVQIAVSLVLFGVVNYASLHYHRSWDLTPAKSHTLSGATLHYLRKLGKDVEMTLVYPRGSTDGEMARALAAQYRQHGKKRVRIEEIDPVRDVDRAEQLKLETGLVLAKHGVLIRANKRQRFVTDDEMRIRDTSKQDNPVVGFRGEDAITSAMVDLLEGGAKKLYIVAGKGTLDSASAEASGEVLAEIAAQANFEVHLLNLAGVEHIPADAAALLFLGPRYDVSERELGMLTDYWRGGRAGLLMMLDPQAVTPRLHAFLSSQGVAPRRDRVLSAHVTGAGPQKEFAVEVAFSATSPLTESLAETLTVLPGQTQSLQLAPEDSPELRDQSIAVAPLLRAGERFWGEVDFLDPLPIASEPDGDILPPVDVAASVELGAAPDERLRVESSRMVVVGNSELLHPRKMLAETKDFVASALNWMVSRERLIGITPKEIKAYRVQLNPKQSQLLFGLTTFALPALALSIGWLIWLGRRSA